MSDQNHLRAGLNSANAGALLGNQIQGSVGAQLYDPFANSRFVPATPADDFLVKLAALNDAVNRARGSGWTVTLSVDEVSAQIGPGPVRATITREA